LTAAKADTIAVSARVIKIVRRQAGDFGNVPIRESQFRSPGSINTSLNVHRYSAKIISGFGAT
jgi:hypothetical protein